MRMLGADFKDGSNKLTTVEDELMQSANTLAFNEIPEYVRQYMTQ